MYFISFSVQSTTQRWTDLQCRGRRKVLATNFPFLSSYHQITNIIWHPRGLFNASYAVTSETWKFHIYVTNWKLTQQRLYCTNSRTKAQHMANVMSWCLDKLQETKVESVYRIINSYPKPDTDALNPKYLAQFHNHDGRLWVGRWWVSIYLFKSYSTRMRWIWDDR